MKREKAMEVLSRAAYGCYLLTVAWGERVNGMPLSLFVQAGFDPPLVACGVARRRRTHAMIEQAKSFGVIFLRKDQRELVDKFKGKGEDPSVKFEGVPYKRGNATGAPVLEDCLGFIECRLVDSFAPGDHTMFVGRVVEAGLVSEGELLTVADLGKHYGG